MTYARRRSDLLSEALSPVRQRPDGPHASPALAPGRPLNRTDVLALQRLAGNAATSRILAARGVQRLKVGEYYEGKQQELAGRGGPVGPGISDEAAEGVGVMFKRAERAARRESARRESAGEDQAAGRVTRKQQRAEANKARRAAQEAKRPTIPKEHKQPARPKTPEELAAGRADWEAQVARETQQAHERECAAARAEGKAAVERLRGVDPLLLTWTTEAVRTSLATCGQDLALELAKDDGTVAADRAWPERVRELVAAANTGLGTRFTVTWLRARMKTLVTELTDADHLGPKQADREKVRIQSRSLKDVKSKADYRKDLDELIYRQHNPQKSEWLQWFMTDPGWSKWRAGLWGSADVGTVGGCKVHATRYLNDIPDPVDVDRPSGAVAQSLLGSGTGGFHVTAEVHGEYGGGPGKENPHAYRGGPTLKKNYVGTDWNGFKTALEQLRNTVVASAEARIEDIVKDRGDR